MLAGGALALLLLPALGSAAPEAAPEPATIREGISKALPLIRTSAAEYTQQRPCFSCHHQAMGVLALSLAKSRGFPVDAADLTAQIAHTEKFLRSGREAYRTGGGQGGAVDTAGYGLWTLEMGGWKADDTTATITDYLLRRNADREFWSASGNRPPSEGSPFTAAYVALRALKTYGTPEQADRTRARVEKVRAWLERAPAVETEERVFRLWALKYAGSAESVQAAAARELLQSQRDDGGWPQTAALQSDAYATGSALVALHETGHLAASAPECARGVAFLLKTQGADGTWHVATRAKPIQTYFESGFPYGKDQFISMAGTCWATAALTLALPPAEK